MVWIDWAEREGREYTKSDVKGFGPTGALRQKLLDLSAEEESGTRSVAVECVDI